jgi:hypothetical protein
MARARTGKAQPSDDVELRPDGWERFEKAVDAAVKSGPKRRSAKKVTTKRKAGSANREK